VVPLAVTVVVVEVLQQDAFQIRHQAVALQQYEHLAVVLVYFHHKNLLCSLHFSHRVVQAQQAQVAAAVVVEAAPEEVVAAVVAEAVLEEVAVVVEAALVEVVAAVEVEAVLEEAAVAAAAHLDLVAAAAVAAVAVVPVVTFSMKGN
jgi:hypothetical protein